MTNIGRMLSSKTYFVVFIVILLVAAGLGLSRDNQKAPTPKLPAEDTASITTAQGSYLDFKDIGVELTLNSTDSDAVYAPFDVPSTDGSRAYGISTTSLINNSGSNTCAATAGPIGLVIATTNPTVITGANTSTQLTPDNKTVFKFGNTYYRYVPPQNFGCNGGNVSVSQIEAAQNAFQQSFATLQTDGTGSSTN